MVAWEKILERCSAPAWRSNYVAYARLKRKLNTITGQPDSDHEQDGVPFVRSISRGIEDSKAPLLNVERAQEALDEFLDAVHTELKRTAAFYDGKVTKLESVVHSVSGSSSSAGAAGLGSSRMTSGDIERLHLEAVQLVDYCMLNAEALRKIVKKFDKQCGQHFQKDFVENHLKRSSLASREKPETPCDGERARCCRRILESLVSPERLKELQSKAMENTGVGLSRMMMKPRRVCLSLLLSLVTLVLAPSLLPDSINAQRCTAMLVLIISLWVSEAAPFEATAMLVPPLTVVTGVLDGDPTEQARALLAVVFNESMFLVLSGFVMSSIFSTCQLDSRAASWLQKKFGRSPFLFLLMLMFLGTWLSAILSNVTAPLLLLQVLKPVLQEFPTDSRYSRALLLGLAFSCNIGGMTTPISSPQNIAALTSLRMQGGDLFWGQWLRVSVPFCNVAIVVVWLVLLMVHNFDLSADEAAYIQSIEEHRRAKSASIPPFIIEHEAMTASKMMALVGAIAVLCSYMCGPIVEFFGDTANIALMFVGFSMFTGVISRTTFNSYSWHLLFLIGGGNALGLAVQKSGLLHIIAQAARAKLITSNPWFLITELVVVLAAATTFVSHTVAALVFMPLVVEVAAAAGVMELTVLLGAFACSVSCALPMTSFPNVNSLMAVDDFKHAYLSMSHFLKAGVPVTILIGGLLCTYGYWLGKFVQFQT